NPSSASDRALGAKEELQHPPHPREPLGERPAVRQPEVGVAARRGIGPVAEPPPLPPADEDIVDDRPRAYALVESGGAVRAAAAALLHPAVGHLGDAGDERHVVDHHRPGLEARRDATGPAPVAAPDTRAQPE